MESNFSTIAETSDAKIAKKKSGATTFTDCMHISVYITPPKSIGLWICSQQYLIRI